MKYPKYPWIVSARQVRRRPRVLTGPPVMPEVNRTMTGQVIDEIGGYFIIKTDGARMQANYQALFRLDYALFKELGVDKNAVREGLKKRIAGLKNTYWAALFEHLDVITSRLSTKTKERFRRRITSHALVAFTASNAYAVALWAIKFANQYFDAQLVQLFRDLSTHDGVENYVSNQRAWVKDHWRYNDENKWPNSHYRLDYRVVVEGHGGIAKPSSYRSYDHPGGLYNGRHELIDDMIAVFGNLGFRVQDRASRTRTWAANEWQDFRMADERVVFQVKGYYNGNIHLRFLPAAIKALNIEAGRLLGWLRSPAEVVTELGYTAADAATYFGANQRLTAGAVRLLTDGGQA